MLYVLERYYSVPSGVQKCHLPDHKFLCYIIYLLDIDISIMELLHGYTPSDIVDSVELQDVLNKFMNRADQWQLPSNTLPDVVDSVALQDVLNKFINRADP